MNTFKRIIVWLCWKPWPVWGMGIVASIHLFVVHMAPIDVAMINKIASACMQIVGGLIILHSVDQNLGLFGKQTLGSLILAWFSNNPFRSPKPASFTIHATTGTAHFSGGVTSIVIANTVEERIAELERATNQLRKELEIALQSGIDKTKQELNASILANQQAVHDLSQKVETATVGGFKQQAFGVMLAAWGAGTSIFA